mmetsp:Transcript_47569/g.115899  ORF Transcript_47569/g.115899 Transcript_47569/m.115899 type:complete len:90 (-) Transcript_47569:31-300(-)
MASWSPGNTSTGDTSLSIAKDETTVESTDAGWQTPGRNGKPKANNRSSPVSGGHGRHPGRGGGRDGSGHPTRYAIHSQELSPGPNEPES